MVYQQVISLVTCFNWKLTGKLRCLVTCQNGLICLSAKCVCFLAVKGPTGEGYLHIGLHRHLQTNRVWFLRLLILSGVILK